MSVLKISSENGQLKITTEKEANDFIYSFQLFDQFAKSMPGLVSNTEGSYIFKIDEDSQRRILNLLDDLKSENDDFEILHSSNIEKNIENIMRESEEFKLFSEKAKNIRNNKIHDFDALENFEDSLKQLKRDLFWHQKLSCYHMSFSNNSCNFSVPGAGKTMVVYAAYNYLKYEDRVDKIIIIGPLSSAIAWEDEYVEAFGVAPNFLKLNGDTPEHKINSIYGNNSPEVFHVNFNSLNKYNEIIKYLCSKNRVMMVVDEAHRVKNPEGFWAKSLLNLVDNINTAPVSRIVLTGTPVPNSYEDIYNLYKFIWPKNDILGYKIGVLRSLNNNPSLPTNRKKIDNLIENISPFYIRIRKSDLGLPEYIINEPLIAQADEKQTDIYEYVKNDFIRSLKKESKGFAYALRLIRLRQAASNPSLLKNPVFFDGIDYSEENEEYLKTITNKIIDYDENYVSSKFTVCMDKVNELIAEKKKVLIWCEFIGSVDKLASLMDSNNISYALLTGSVTDFDERKRIVEDFNSKTGMYDVILATPLAVGESISLHKNCHDAIYFEISFNAGLHLQSMDRIHRLGLDSDAVTNYWYIQSSLPIEKYVLERIRAKEEKMRKIIDSKEIPLISDYRSLFDNPYEHVDLREILKGLESE